MAHYVSSMCANSVSQRATAASTLRGLLMPAVKQITRFFDCPHASFHIFRFFLGGLFLFLLSCIWNWKIPVLCQYCLFQTSRCQNFGSSPQSILLSTKLHIWRPHPHFPMLVRVTDNQTLHTTFFLLVLPERHTDFYFYFSLNSQQPLLWPSELLCSYNLYVFRLSLPPLHVNLTSWTESIRQVMLGWSFNHCPLTVIHFDFVAFERSKSPYILKQPGQHRRLNLIAQWVNKLFRIVLTVDLPFVHHCI